MLLIMIGVLQMRYFLAICGVILSFSSNVWAFGSGSATCDVVADYSTITSMSDRVRNPNPGNYQMTSNTPFYNGDDHVEITIQGPTFTGVLLEVVDDDGNNVGTFSPDPEIRTCDGSAMSATHTSAHGNVSSRTFFWIPPDESVGDVYVLAYVLSGVRGNRPSQQFFRFVREDNSALTIVSDTVFANSFE